MLHVIWTIIKIILLILAVLLGIAAILLLAVLFIPVRYQARGKKGETAAELQAKLSWMGSLINIPVSYQDGVLSAKLRVFGFSVRNLLEEEEPFTEFEKEFFTEPEEETQEERKEEFFTEPEKETEKIEEEAFTEPGEETREREREPSQSREFSEGQAPPVKQGKLKCTFKRFCDKIKRIRKKYKRFRKFAEDERTKAAFQLIRDQLISVFLTLLPRKAEGWILFGTEDPALTGEILGAVSIFYPVFMDTVKITPDFEKAILEGDLSVRGRFYIITAVRAAWKLFRDKNVRWTYRTLKLL